MERIELLNPKAVWDELGIRKTRALERAREASFLSLPHLVPPDGVLPDDITGQEASQSLVAHGVNEVANKFLMALFRPSRPFFRLEPTELGRKKFQEEFPGAPESDLISSLVAKEQEIMRRWASGEIFPQLLIALQHILVAGSCLILKDDPGISVIPIQDFSVKRSTSGTVIDLVYRETYDVREIPVEAIRTRYAASGSLQPREVTLYTHWTLAGPSDKPEYYLIQSVEDNVFYRSERPVKEEDLPWFIAGWIRPQGAQYHYGLMYQHIADIRAYELTSRAVLDCAAQVAEWRWLVDPAGQTRPKDLASSKRGAILPGRATDIALSPGGDPAVFGALDTVLQRYENRLGRVFILQGASIRDSERTTAEEIRLVAQELETQYSGAYSSLALQMQLPLARWEMRKVDTGEDGSVEAKIITGIDVLSRASDLNDFRDFLQNAAMVANLPPPLLDRLDWHAVLAMIGNGTNIQANDVLISEEEYNERVQQQQQPTGPVPGADPTGSTGLAAGPTGIPGQSA